MGQYPIQLGVLLEGVADRERGMLLGRKPFAATAVRDDQNVVEHRFFTVAPRASRVRLVVRIATYSGVFALDLDQALPDAGRIFNRVSQRCLKLSGEVEALIRGDEVGGA